VTFQPIAQPRRTNVAIDTQLKSVWSALPLDAEMARSALRNIERIFHILQEERDIVLRDANRWIEAHNEAVSAYNGMVGDMGDIRRILDGEDIHENCGY